MQCCPRGSGQLCIRKIFHSMLAAYAILVLCNIIPEAPSNIEQNKIQAIQAMSVESRHWLMCKTNSFHNRLYVLLSFVYVLFSFGYALFSFGYALFSFKSCALFIWLSVLFSQLCDHFIRLRALFIWLWVLFIWLCAVFIPLCALSIICFFYLLFLCTLFMRSFYVLF